LVDATGAGAIVGHRIHVLILVQDLNITAIKAGTGEVIRDVTSTHPAPRGHTTGSPKNKARTLN